MTLRARVGLACLGTLSLAATGVLVPLPSAAATGVTNVALSTSGTVGGESNVSWTLVFTTTGGPAASITVAAPAASFPGSASAYTVSGQTVNTATPGSGTVTITVTPGLGANTQYTLTIHGLTNPSAGTAYSSVTVATSADTTPTGVSSVGAFTTPNPVTGLSFHPITTTAGGALSSWDLFFTTSAAGGLNIGDKLTVSAPMGTVFNTPVSGNPTISDLTAISQGNGLCCRFNMSLSSSGTNPVVATLTISSAISGSSIPAGHRVSIDIPQVTNPAATTAFSTIMVATQPDLTPVAVPGGDTFTTPHSVSGLIFTPSNSVGGAAATWSFGYTVSSTGRLAPHNSTITITAPSGLPVPEPGPCDASSPIVILDLSTGFGDRCDTVLAGSPSTLSFTTPQLHDGSFNQNPFDIRAGDVVRVIITHVTNPSSTMFNTIGLATGSDTTVVHPVSGSFTAGPAAVTNVVLTPSSPAAGATHVAWTLGFVATDELPPPVNNATASDVTVVVPAGTTPPPTLCGNYVIVDAATGQNAQCQNIQFNGISKTLTIGVPFDIPAGDPVLLHMAAFTNPSAGPFSGVTVATSADQTAVAASGGSFSLQQPISGLTVTTTSAAAIGANTGWAIDFTTSRTGGLAAGVGTIVVTAPSGTVLPSGAGNYELVDATTGVAFPGIDADGNGTGPPTASGGGTTITVTTPLTVNPTDELRLLIHNVTNPGAGPSNGVTVVTSSDSSAMGGPAFAAGEAPSGATLVPSNTTGAATGVSWSVGFNSTSGLDPGDGMITVQGPAATAFTSGSSNGTVIDLRSGEQNSANVTAAGTSAVVTVPGNVTIRAGDPVLAVLRGVTNPAASTAFSTVAVSTSGDPVGAHPSSGSFDGSVAPTQLANPAFAVSTTAGGATGVVWTFGLTIGTGGALTNTDSLRLSTPGGSLPANGGAEQCPYTVVDLTSGASSCPGGTVSTGTATVPMPFSAAVGDQLLLVASGVTNPVSTTAMSSIGLTTTKASANTIHPASGTFTTAQAVTSVSFATNTAAGGATAAAWTIGLTTSSTGGLAASRGGEPLGGIEIKTPSGALPIGDGTRYIATDATSGAATVFELMFSGSTGTDVTFGPTIATEAGDRIVVRTRIDGMTNPTAATAFSMITVSTGSDPNPVGMPGGTFSAAGSPASASLLMSTTAGGATGTTWTFVFTASALAHVTGGTITATLPSGTGFSGFRCRLTDVTRGQTQGGGCNLSSTTVTQTVPFDVGNGDLLSWALVGVTNPAASTSLTAIPLTTSTDTQAANPTPPAPGSTTTAQSVVSPELAASSLSSNAGGVRWTVGFTASTTGDLEPGSSSITLTAPSGTSFDNTLSRGGCIDHIIDVTRGWMVVCPGITGGGSTITIQLTGFISQAGPLLPIHAGDVVLIELRYVTNPPGAPSFTGLGITTTSDPAAAHPSGTFTAATSVSGLTLKALPDNAGSSGSTWTFDFTTSNGGPVQRIEQFIHVDLAGGSWPFQNCRFVIEDVTEGWWQRTCFIMRSGDPSPTVSGSQQFGDNAVAPGDKVEVVLFQVNNPAMPSAFTSVTLTTDADTVAAHPSGMFGPPPQLYGRILDLQGHPVSAAVQACHASTCLISPANLAGAYGFAGPLTQGTWSLTVFPEQNQNVTLTSASVLVGTGRVTRDITLNAASSLPSGITVNGSGAQARVFWGSPSSVSFSPASVGCSGGTIVGDAIRVTGVDTQTGVLSNQDFPIGGTLNGVPIGVVGTPNVNGIIPALAPVHGSVSISLRDTCYLGATAPPPPGIASSSTVFFFDDSIGEHQKAQISNGSANNVSVNGAPETHISGINAADFAVEPATPPGSVVDCGSAQVAVGQQQSCFAQVHWTPDSNPNDVEEFATLRMPVNSSYVDIDLHGCSRIKAARFGRTCGQPTPAPPAQGVSLACPTSDGSVGHSYSDSVVATGGTPPFTYSLTSGAPPPGLSLGSDGHITGMPTTPGTFLFGVEATDSSNPAITEGVNCDIAVDQNTPSISCPAGVGQSGTPYGSGISAGGGTAPYTLSITGSLPPGLGFDSGSGSISGTPSAEGVNTFTAHVVDHASASNSVTCTITVSVPVYVDPSGTVSAELNGGTPQPVSGATVTLLQSATAGGPFTAVPNGSAVMSPSNQSNPSATDSQGRYGWDVVAGFYQIQAHLAGCTDATSSVLPVPPPHTGVDLLLTDCSSLPARTATTTSLGAAPPAPSAPGQPVTLSATVSPAATGTVSFTDGATPLGSAPVLAGGHATLTTAALSSGAHSITAAYSGDAADAPSSTGSVPYSVNPGTQTAVTGVTASPSPSTAGSTAAYTVGFTTSASGAMNPGFDTITLAAPAGTVFSATAADDTVNGVAASTINGGGTSQVTITVPAAASGVGALAPVTVVAHNTVNPAAGTDTLSVSTSKDTVSVASGQYGIGAAAAPTPSPTPSASPSPSGHPGPILPPIHVPPPPIVGPPGYWLVASDGGVFPFGSATGFGSLGNVRLNKPIVGVAATPDGGGYWLVAADGGVFPFGDAGGYGSTGNLRLNQPIVGMAATPDGGGYWLVAADGGVFPFGDAGGYGSTGNVHLNRPVVGIASSFDGGGYWLVASDGGIFPFGDAPGYGSTGNLRLNRPIVGMASTHDGGGYWLVAGDGGIFPFGDASGFGSTGNMRLDQPIVGIASTRDGGGYWLVAADGGIFPFGDAAGLGSTALTRLNRPMVGMAGR